MKSGIELRRARRNDSLDTHVVIWLLMAPERLSKRAREAILQARIAGERIGLLSNFAV